VSDLRHGRAIEKGLGPGHAAPEDRTVPQRRPLTRKQTPASLRMDPVGGHQKIEIHFIVKRFVFVAVEKCGNHTGRRARPCAQLVSRRDALRAKAVLDGVQQERLQQTPVD